MIHSELSEDGGSEGEVPSEGEGEEEEEEEEEQQGEQANDSMSLKAELLKVISQYWLGQHSKLTA